MRIFYQSRVNISEQFCVATDNEGNQVTDSVTIPDTLRCVRVLHNDSHRDVKFIIGIKSAAKCHDSTD